MQKKLLDHLLDILADISNSNNDISTTQRSQVRLNSIHISFDKIYLLKEDSNISIDKLN